MKGTIVITLEGVSISQTERYRLLIHELFAQGALDIKAGSVTLHFDDVGMMQEVEYNFKRKRNKPALPLQEVLKNATIEVTK